MGRRLLPLLSLPLLAATLTGCAGDAIALDPVATAVVRTARVPSARFVLDARVAVSGRARHVRGDGAIDLSHGLVAYLRLPTRSARLPRGRHWVRFDLVRALRAEGLDLGRMLDALGETRDSHRVGRERIDGRVTTRFRIQLDLRRLAPPLARRLGTDTLHAEAWVDEGGLLRRLRLQVAAGPLAVTAAVTLDGFRTPTRLTLPPADEVVDGAAVASAERAEAGVRDAAAAAETYSLNNSGYLGMTPKLLRGVDRSLDPALRIVIASAEDYCIELTVGSATAHAAGPPAKVAPGPC